MSSISSLFGIILNYIYGIINNYGLAIIIFSVLLKIVLLPLSIKQQKTMKKTAKIQGKIKELQEKYKNDQNKMNQEMMAVYKEENMSPFSGCLSSIIQIVLLLAMFGLVRSPLTYMLKIDNNTIQKTQNYIVQEENYSISQRYPQIGILKYVSNNKDKVIEIDKEGGEEGEKEELKLEDMYINMDFIGLDLSNIPQENWQNPTVYIIPVLYVLTTMVSMKLTTKMTQANTDKKEDVIEIKPEKDEKESSNEDEKKEEMQDMATQMSKSMSWFMPIMSVSISIIAPLGLALYWLVNNILMIAERLILNKIIKTDEEEAK